MKVHFFILRILSSIMALCLFSTANAGSPLWTFTPLTATTLSVPLNETALVQYTVTNQSSRVHKLTLLPIQGITQVTTGLGVCGNPPFVLTGNGSCTLSLEVNGSQLTSAIHDGPIVCEQDSTLQCYRPAPANILNLTQAATIDDAIITVTNSPLTLITNGDPGSLTITNTSLTVTATNIVSDFTGTALSGNVTESNNTCASVAPLATCTLTYQPGSTVVSQTDFTIKGSNTNEVTAAIKIESGLTLTSVSPSSGSASGGTAVTLTGTGLGSATSVAFGDAYATSVNVVNSTTVTAVTPRNGVGAKNVIIEVLVSGSATLTNGYTYETTAVGQPALGGTIACLNPSNNLIAATANNSSGIIWGDANVPTATSTTAGASNTANIVTALGSGSDYAAGLCSNYEVDSLGNSPCISGNTCYRDWFLPAGFNSNDSGQLNCLLLNRVLVGGFTDGTYWSSTQVNGSDAYAQFFPSGNQFQDAKDNTRRVRCVRSFAP